MNGQPRDEDAVVVPLQAGQAGQAGPAGDAGSLETPDIALSVEGELPDDVAQILLQVLRTMDTDDVE